MIVLQSLLIHAEMYWEGLPGCIGNDFFLADLICIPYLTWCIVISPPPVTLRTPRKTSEPRRGTCMHVLGVSASAPVCMVHICMERGRFRAFIKIFIYGRRLTVYSMYALDRLFKNPIPVIISMEPCTYPKMLSLH